MRFWRRCDGVEASQKLKNSIDQSLTLTVWWNHTSIARFQYLQQHWLVLLQCLFNCSTQCDLCKQALRQVRKQSQNHFYIILVKYISVVLKSKYVDFLKRIVKNNFSSFLAIFQNSATVTLDGFFPDRIFLNEEGSVFLSKWPACKVFLMPIPHIYLTCMPTGSPTFWITLFVFPPTIEKGLIPQHVFM